MAEDSTRPGARAADVCPAEVLGRAALRVCEWSCLRNLERNSSTRVMIALNKHRALANFGTRTLELIGRFVVGGAVVRCFTQQLAHVGHGHALARAQGARAVR